MVFMSRFIGLVWCWGTMALACHKSKDSSLSEVRSHLCEVQAELQVFFEFVSFFFLFECPIVLKVTYSEQCYGLKVFQKVNIEVEEDQKQQTACQRPKQ